jgi:hypothetical protein
MKQKRRLALLADRPSLPSSSSERSRWHGGRCRVGDVGSPDFWLR